MSSSSCDLRLRFRTSLIADPEALALMAKLWNAGRMVRIHTIALGEDSDLLKRLAGSSGGVYRVAR